MSERGTYLRNGKGTADDEKKWIMCPVCYEPNPPGRTYCKYCSGNRITNIEVQPLRSLSEIEQLRKEGISRRRRIKIIKRLLLASLSFAAVVALTVAILFMFTDVIGAPRVSVNSNSAPGEWSMFRHDTAGTSAYGSTEVPEGVLKWKFATDGFITASPAVVDGKVYIGSTDRTFYALDAKTGERLWSFKAKSWIESSAAVSGGVVYVGSNDSSLYALDAETGEKIWEYRAKFGIRSSPAVTDGRVYFSSGEYMIYALDAKTGELEWRYVTDGNVPPSPVIANGLLYVGDTGGYFYAIDAVTGRRRLQFKVYGDTRVSAVVDGDKVYFANTKGILFCIDGNARNWPNEHNFRLLLYKIYVQSLSVVPPMWLIPPAQSGYLWGLVLDGRTYSSPVINEGVLYIGSGDKLVAVDLESRQMHWEFAGGDTIKSSPAYAGGTLFAGCNDGKLYAVSADTGVKLWEYETGAQITSSPAVVDGTVYITSHDGFVYAIE